MHDVVIRDGLIVDGTGAAAAAGDVAIDRGKITSVGGKAGPGQREFRADGQLVTPGWVDIHTHYDGQVMWDPEMGPSAWHGVTTVVIGNCGVGFAPVRPGTEDQLISLMEGVEDIPAASLAEGLGWGWESFPEYLDALDRIPRSIDIAAQVPHGALRTYVMGDRGTNNEAATPDDIGRMADLVTEAVRAGAAGFTTSRTRLHRTAVGAFTPEMTASADELVGIARGLGAAGRGCFGIVSDFEDLNDEFAWMRTVAETSRRPTWFLLAQTDRHPDHWRDMLALCRDTAVAGAPITAQVAGRPVGLLLGLEASLHPFISRPSYRTIADKPLAGRVAIMRDQAFRTRLLGEPVSHRSDLMNDVTGGFHKMFALGARPDYEPTPDQSIAAIAARDGRDPADVAYDMLLERDGRALLFHPAFNYAGGDMTAIREMLLDDNTVLGLSDGGAHCGLVCDASVPSFMLAHWVRDRRRGDKLPLERVVKAQTSETAALYGFADRGVLAPGKKADVNIIDLDHLQLRAPEMVYDFPANGRRLIQRVDGYSATIVDGVATFEDGVATGERPGQLVRGGQI
jgi:N-acyl-D-aspartate/D-glutamate deacylase